jgi:hypothetical protein
MLIAISDQCKIEEAAGLLETYGCICSEDAVALTRAAGQYADALWWADADPRISWIKLVGALETAANRFDTGIAPTAIDQLKRHRGRLYGRLKSISVEAVEIVASALAGLLNAEAKMVGFTLEHAPDPPQRRPSVGQFDFGELESALHTIYNWRSRDLHDGIPIPAPMCEPPMTDDDGVPHERMPFIAATDRGGTWRVDEELPMYLHLFVHVVGGALGIPS